MASRPALLVLIVPLLLIAGPPAGASEGAEPLAGAILGGKVGFPRPQGMTVRVDTDDTSRLAASVAFDGRCRGGGLGELWAAYIPAREEIRVRHGRFKATLTGTTHDVGATGRTGSFRWRLSGRFLAGDTATATVDGTAVVRAGRRVVSRCAIGKPAKVRLTLGG